MAIMADQSTSCALVNTLTFTYLPGKGTTLFAGKQGAEQEAASGLGL